MRASWVMLSTQKRPRYSRGLFGLSTATRSGRHLHPCSIRPSVARKDPEAWLNMTRKFGYRSNTPEKTMEQAAREVSAGMPTSQGSQYLVIISLPIMSHGWTMMHIPSRSQASQIAWNRGSDRL